jgi:hypothetical protein
MFNIPIEKFLKGEGEFDDLNPDYPIEWVELGETIELLGTGTYSRLLPCTRRGNYALQAGSFLQKPHTLYFEFTEKN